MLAKIATTFNASNPKKVSYEQVEVLDTFSYGDYTLFIHNHYNQIIGGSCVSEYYTGRHIKSFTMEVSKEDSQKIESIKKATIEHLDGFSDLIGDKIKGMKKVNE